MRHEDSSPGGFFLLSLGRRFSNSIAAFFSSPQGPQSVFFSLGLLILPTAVLCRAGGAVIAPEPPF